MEEHFYIQLRSELLETFQFQIIQVIESIQAKEMIDNEIQTVWYIQNRLIVRIQSRNRIRYGGSGLQFESNQQCRNGISKADEVIIQYDSLQSYMERNVSGSREYELIE